MLFMARKITPGIEQKVRIVESPSSMSRMPAKTSHPDQRNAAHQRSCGAHIKIS